MAKSLVIVESPAKAKTINKFLGKDFSVKASMGHVRDLPRSKLGVDVEDGFKPHYINIKDRREVIKELRESASKSEAIYIATDPDREGEAISWHLSSVLNGQKKKKKKDIYRVLFNEITERAVLEAMKSPRVIDMDKVDAQQARRVLDRLVGYKLSPLLWKKVQKGLSAGRVQSVALRLIWERQREIDAFVPEEYWSVTALLKNHKGEAFEAKLFRIGEDKVEIKNEAEALKITEGLKGSSFIVNKIQRKKQRRKPTPPFTTSKMQQEASRKFGYTSKRTMLLAQQLYEGIELEGGDHTGLITYMRTDSTRVSEEAQAQAREYIEQNYGADYLPDKTPVYATKGKHKKIQDAHEAIRPTSTEYEPKELSEHLTPDQRKLYGLIWGRFLASQMTAAILDLTTVDIEAGDCTFRANGLVVKFRGFMAAYVESRDSGEDDSKNRELPLLNEGDELTLVELVPKQHFTSPPPLFTDATLVKSLEELGIGRPSTYAPIIGTLESRDYIVRDGRRFIPTELGGIVTELLVESFPNILNVDFTANMEDDLDEVEEGNLEWVQVIKDFYGGFEETLKKAELEMKDLKTEESPTKVVCEKCGRDMVIKRGRNGRFLACPGYPECKNTKNFEELEDGSIKVVVGDETTDKVCEKCGGPMVIKRGRAGAFLACGNYPECKNTKPIDIGIDCPREDCDGKLVKRITKRRRPFYGCNNYPNCDFALWNRPVGDKCPECGSLLVEKITKKGQFIVCSSKECHYEKTVEADVGSVDAEVAKVEG